MDTPVSMFIAPLSHAALPSLPGAEGPCLVQNVVPLTWVASAQGWSADERLALAQWQQKHPADHTATSPVTRQLLQRGVHHDDVLRQQIEAWEQARTFLRCDKCSTIQQAGGVASRLQQ